MMVWFDTASWLRMLCSVLELPTHLLLVACAALTCTDVGISIGERLRGLARLQRYEPAHTIEWLAKRRIERADLLARGGPMLGLMGTLIPLGPGLAALGRGDVAVLASAVTVAFDTTVLGLAIGMVGFILGRLRRRWYEVLLDGLEAAHGA